MRSLFLSTYLILFFSSFSFSQEEMQVTYKIQYPSSSEMCDGYVEFSVQGGTPPYLFSNVNGFMQSSNMIDGLCEGMYEFEVIDSMGYFLRQMFSLIPPNHLNKPVVWPSGIQNSGIVEIRFDGVPPYSYSLNNSAFTSQHIFSDLAPGTYSYSIKDSYGSNVHSSVTIESIDLDNSVIAIGDELIANLDAVSFQWIDSDTQIPIEGATGRTLKTGRLGRFRVEMTLGNPTNAGRNLENQQFIKVSSATIEVSSLDFDSELVKVFPNPSKGIISFPTSLKGKEFSIYSMAGKEVLSGVISDQQIRIEKLEKGMYFLKMEGYKTTKIVKN